MLCLHRYFDDGNLESRHFINEIMIEWIKNPEHDIFKQTFHPSRCRVLTIAFVTHCTTASAQQQQPNSEVQSQGH